MSRFFSYLFIYSIMIFITNLLYYDFINLLYSAILGFIVLGSKVVASIITPACGGKVFVRCSKSGYYPYPSTLCRRSHFPHIPVLHLHYSISGIYSAHRGKVSWLIFYNLHVAYCHGVILELWIIEYCASLKVMFFLYRWPVGVRPLYRYAGLRGQVVTLSGRKAFFLFFFFTYNF